RDQPCWSCRSIGLRSRHQRAPRRIGERSVYFAHRCEFVPINGMSRSSGSERLFPMKKTAQHLIAEVPRRQSRAETTIGIDLGDVWSHYCTLNETGEMVDRGRFRTSPKELEKWFTDVPPARVAMEVGTHSIWVSEQLQEFGHEVIVA